MEAVTVLVSLIFGVAVGIGIPIASLVIAANNDACQKGVRGGLDASGWLTLVAGPSLYTFVVSCASSVSSRTAT